jgi:hypothetical protein
MGLLDRLFGGNRDRQRGDAPQYAPPASTPQDTPRPARTGQGREGGDEAAIERYRYLLRTAPPEAIEQAHAEAFATLTPEQRRTVLTELGSQVPASERAASDDPKALARMATRAEMRQPGLLERTFSGRGGGMGGGYGMGGGMGMGGMLAGGLFASMAGAFVGTAIAEEIFNDDHDNDAGDNNDDSTNDNGNDGNDSGNDGSGDNSGGDQSDAQTVSDSGDYGSGGYDGGDYGNDGYGGGDGSGDASGGFGGGDYGGGFGGGDYGGGFGGGDYGGGDVGGGDLGGGFDA